MSITTSSSSNNNNNNPNNVIFEAYILLMCGLPGSGKSTLTSSIVNYYQNRSDDDTLECTTSTNDSIHSHPQNHFHKVVNINYDQITASLTSQSTTTETITDSTNPPIINKVNMLFTNEELQAWRMTRKVALSILKENLENGYMDAYQKQHNAAQDIHTNNNDNNDADEMITNRIYTLPWRILIILDDNFHLRSMRRQVYKTCQDFLVEKQQQEIQNETIRIGFSILHVNTTVSTCLDRNEQRLGDCNHNNNYIPQNIIINMSQTLEPPNPTKYKFESSSLCIDNNHDHVNYDPSETKNSSNNNNITSLQNTILMEVNSLLELSLQQHPILPPLSQNTIESSSRQLELERTKTLASKQHRLDLLLRHLVGVTCKVNKQYSQAANKARKYILQHYPETSILSNINHNSSNDDNDEDWSDCTDEDYMVLNHFQQLVLFGSVVGNSSYSCNLLDNSNISSTTAYYTIIEETSKAYSHFIRNYNSR